VRGRGLQPYRLAAALTQQQLADKAACSIQYVQLVENGWTPSTVTATFERLAWAAGCTVDDLRGGGPGP
jgi:hypothetical protein